MKLNSLKKFENFALFILRLGLGLTFMIEHGGPKLFSGPEKWASYGKAMESFGITFAPVFWGLMAGLFEFLGGLLLFLGLFTRQAAIMLMLVLLVALSSHIAGGRGIGYPLEMFLVMFALLFIGAGKYSLDNFLLKRS